MDRVKYYSTNDLCYGAGIDRIETFTIPEYSAVCINDAIEYSQLFKYLSEGARLKAWTDADFAAHLQKSKRLIGLANRFFNSLSDDNINQHYEQVESLYVSVFWEIFESSGLYNRISEVAFSGLLQSRKIPLSYILEKKNTVRQYGASIRELILSNATHAELLIRCSEQDYTDYAKLYLPDELSGEEIIALIDQYLNSPRVNSNYANSIFQMQPSKRFPVTDELRLKAKRTYATAMERVASEGVSLQSGIQVSISKEQEEPKVEKAEGMTLIASYSYDYLCSTLDHPSILNNFIYLFGFVDEVEMRCNHVSVDSKAGILERAFRSRSSRQYNDHFMFKYTNGFAALQINAYICFLKDRGVRLEEVLQWFFTDYLSGEFGCPKLRVSFPSEQSTPLEKCVNICTAMEMVLKQFSQYATKHEIDFELLGMSSVSQKFDQIPSLVHDKYIYGSSTRYQHLANLLFSDQCMLSFVQRIHEQNKEYRSLYDLLKSEEVTTADYSEQDILCLKLLEDNDLISITSAGNIILGNKWKLTIIKDLVNHEVISRWHYPDDVQDIFDEWIRQDILRSGSSLLSIPESNYYSYMLNRERFVNGFDLRNKYAHGNGQIIEDEKEHISNYLTLLRLMIILAIKINDDFCLFDAIKPSERE